MSSFLFSYSVRSLRTRTVLLALLGSVALLYITGSYYTRQTASLKSWIPTRYLGPGRQRTQQDSDKYAEQHNDCWSQWFSHGTVCAEPPELWLPKDKLDLVWTWSNVTLEALARTSPTQASDNKTRAQPSSNEAEAEHAEHTDLLRYSFRSAQRHLLDGFARVSILTPDAAQMRSANDDTAGGCSVVYRDESNGSHSGQMPCWLKLAVPHYVPPRLVHLRQVACASQDQLAAHACIESRLATMHEPSARMLATQIDGLSDVRLVVSPHHMFVKDVSASDFYSPLYGSVFRLNADWSQSGVIDSNSHNDTDPIDGPMIRANRLLDLRFGTRARRRLLDLPQPISNTIVDEVYQTWPKELGSLSSESTRENVDLVFLATHYTIEKHREVVLWSFIVAKHDRDGDGNLSPIEARNLLNELGASANDDFRLPEVKAPTRETTSNATMTENLKRAGLPVRMGVEHLQSSLDGTWLVSPRSPAVADAQNVDSADGGGGHVQQTAPTFCVLSRDCLSPLIDAASGRAPGAVTSDVFKQIAFQSIACGDCLLVVLVGKSGRKGLSALLPAADLEMPAVQALPTTPTFQEINFSIRSFPKTAHKVKRMHVVAGMLSRFVYSIVLQEQYVTSQLGNRVQAKDTLVILEHFRQASLLSFRRLPLVGNATLPQSEDAWIWGKYARSWLSLRFPFRMRFEKEVTHV